MRSCCLLIAILAGLPAAVARGEDLPVVSVEGQPLAVSYTHLTLPTILRV